MINNIAGVGPYDISIDGGNTVSDNTVFTNLEPGEYVISILDTTTGCEYTETVSIIFETSSTYFINGATVEVDIIPNPTDGVFKIQVADLPSSEIFLDVEIYDIQGKLLQNRQIGKFNNEYIGTFSLFAYPAGTYLVRVKSGQNNFLERIVKQ